MTQGAWIAILDNRALVRLSGPDWRSFLQGLITQDAETIQAGEVRYGALLTPQGRLLHDLFLWADEDGATLDVEAGSRAALVSRLSMYRLRAKVEITACDGQVRALSANAECSAPDVEAGWRRDPRLAALGWRTIAPAAPNTAEGVTAEAYDAHRMRLGVGDLVRDGLMDRAYALEANFDLLNAIDFKKGCFVGQETTSRMKRRAVVKTRLVPLTFEGAPPAPGAEVLVGSLRAGEVCSGQAGRALALLRLDRAQDGQLSVEGRPMTIDPQPWLQPALAEMAAQAV